MSTTKDNRFYREKSFKPEPVAFMFWNEPDTQRHFSLLRETIGNHWTNIVPLGCIPEDLPEPRVFTPNTLVERLRGVVRVPVNDDAGLLDGKDFFERSFPTSNLAREAADEIERLTSALSVQNGGTNG